MPQTRLLFHSNAPWVATGYGNQCGLFAPLLAEHYDLAISTFYGLEGSRITWQGIPVFPGLGGEYGGDYLHRHAKSWFGGDQRGGIVMTLMDVWVLPNSLGGELNLVAWTPVDHEPVQDPVKTFFATGAVPMAMSRFGERELRDVDPLYVPHGIDTELYRPYDKSEVRKLVGLSEDAFVIGMVAANKGRPSRKGFQQALEAFRLFTRDRDDVYLYLHTTVDPHVAQGEHIHAIVNALGLPMNRVLTADQYQLLFDPPDTIAMAKIYSTFDVLVNPAMGEGFGIPIVEAQACGVPVVVTNFTAMPEVGKVGWHVGCRPWWTGHQSWQAIADVEEIAEAFKHCYSLPSAARKELSRRAREHALDYDVRKVFDEHMLPALKEAERRFEAREPITLQPRRELKAAA